jgi:signal transduction histidine kinase
MAIDAAICAVLLYTGLRITTDVSAPQGAGAGTSWDTILIPAAILPVLLRGRAPLAAAAAFAAGCVVSALPTFDQFRVPVVLPAALLIAYSTGREPHLRRAVAGLALVLAALVVVGLTDPVLDDEGGLPAMVAFGFPAAAGIWSAARLLTSTDRLAAELDERSRLLEHRREETARLAVEVERTQLASALDAAARDRVRTIVELAAGDGGGSGTFTAIERLGRESLNEMRELLGVLRSDARGPRSPRPTLAQIETLLADARRGGRVVDLEVEGDRRPLPDAVELAAYRLVQHALVAVRGTDGAPARIQVRYGVHALELVVTGSPSDGRSAHAALLAARERVASHGGHFSTDLAAPGARVLRMSLPTVPLHA